MHDYHHLNDLTLEEQSNSGSFQLCTITGGSKEGRVDFRCCCPVGQCGFIFIEARDVRRGKDVQICEMTVKRSLPQACS